MFGLPWKLIAAAVAALSLVAAVALHFRNDAKTRDALETLSEQANTVVVTLRQASGNDDVTWETTPGQIVAMGESINGMMDTIKANNQTITEQAREAVRLKAKASDLMRIVEKAQAQKRAALTKLADLEATPGERSDCMLMLKEASEAIEIAKEASR